MEAYRKGLDINVECVLYGRCFVLEKIVTSKGFVKGNTLCLSISGLCSSEACLCLVFVLSSWSATSLLCKQPLIILLFFFLWLTFWASMFSLNIKCRIEPSSRRNHCGNPEKMLMCDWVTREMEKNKVLLLQNLEVDRLLKDWFRYLFQKILSRKLIQNIYLKVFHHLISLFQSVF